MASLIEPSEAIDLILVLAAVPILMRIASGSSARRLRIFGLAYAALIGASVATIAEAYLLPEFLNIAEHALYALCGTLFVAAISTSAGPDPVSDT